MSKMEEMMAAVEAAAAKEAGTEPPKPAKKNMTGHLDVDGLMEMKMPDLKALATDMGLTFPANIKKADLAEMVAAEQVEVEEEATIEDADLPEDAAGAALGVILDDAPEDDATEGQTDDPAALECEDVKMSGRVLVIYTGMVNLRDEDLHVVGQAMQGQTFAVTGRRTVEGVTWYRIADQAGEAHLIRADLVRYMEK